MSTPGGAPRRLALRGLRRLLTGAALGLVVGAALWALRDVRAVRALEGPLLDVRTRWFAGDHPPAADIVVVQVEDSDVQEVQRDLGHTWPWPLSINAEIFGLFADAGVRAVLLDVYHLDRGAGEDDVPDRRALGPEAAAELIGESEMAENEYAPALRRLGRVALAFQLDDEPRHEVPARVAAVGDRLALDGVEAPAGAYARKGANLPVRRVLEGAARLGFANVEPDPDGVVRRAYLAGRWGDRPVPSLALAGAQLLLGPGTGDARGRFVVGGRPVPTDASGAFLVDFRRARAGSAYARISPAKVLQWHQEAKAGGVPVQARAALAGKIVVWGKNLAGEDDLVPTPIGAATDGPEVQAAILDNLLHGGGRVPASPLGSLVWILALCGLTGLVTLGSRAKHLPHVGAFLLVLATVGGSFVAFGRGTAFDLLLPLVGVFLTWGGCTTTKLLTEGRYNKWLEGTFSRYLAPSVIDALKQDPRLLELGGTERDVTVLFSDIAHFTTLSERLTPAQLVTLLNRYLTAHCDAVFAHGGVVDKFIGDAVMAFYGDPIAQPDHALRACRTALNVRASLPALEPVWRGMDLPHFDVRIGLNSGRAVLGNMGSEQRFSYTAMGDTVNLASRLEGANKAFGTHILLGGSTYEAVREHVLAKPLARLGVVGREEPVAVYELVALRAGATPEQVRHVEAFARAHAAARAGDVSASQRHLAEAEALAPGDGPCAWLRTLLGRLEAGSEPSPWSGVLVLTGK